MKVEDLDGKMVSITKDFYNYKRGSAYQKGSMGASCSFTYRFEQEAYNKGAEDSARAKENK